MWKIYIDTYEIEKAVSVLNDYFKVGAFDCIVPLLNSIIEETVDEVAAFKDEHELYIFQECKDISDILHLRPYLQFDESKAYMDVILRAYSLRGACEFSSTTIDDVKNDLDDFEIKLKLAFLMKLQAKFRETVCGGGKSKRRRLGLIWGYVYKLVETSKGRRTAQEIWDWIGEEGKSGKNRETGELRNIYTDGEVIYELVKHPDGKKETSNGISRASFNRYVTMARKLWKKSVGQKPRKSKKKDSSAVRR